MNWQKSGTFFFFLKFTRPNPPLGLAEIGRMFQAWVFTIQVDVSGDDLGTSSSMIYYKTIIVCLFDLLLLVQCNLDLVTLLVSAKTVTKLHIM